MGAVIFGVLYIGALAAWGTFIFRWQYRKARARKIAQLARQAEINAYYAANQVKKEETP